MGFWQEHCDARPEDLKHRHAQDCADGHLYDQCCECGLQARDWVQSVDLTPPVPVVRPVTKGHPYQFTIAGFCGGCGGVQDDHPLIGVPDPMTGCDVDHKSLKPAHLLGDGGWVWSSCPRCGIMVEPNLATHVMVGRNEGRGRLPFVNRHWKELDTMRLAYAAGYYQ